MALCVFRIVQEGLRNLKKHSGAAKAEVHLRKATEKLFVSVSDEGVGFDIRELIKKGRVWASEAWKNACICWAGDSRFIRNPGRGREIEAWVALQPKSELATR